MIILILYVILVISTCALICVGIAMYLRVRRLARASETQFRQALEEGPEPRASGQEERSTATAPEIAR